MIPVKEFIDSNIINEDKTYEIEIEFNTGKIIVSPELYKIMIINGKIAFFVISKFFNQFNNTEFIDIKDDYTPSQKNTVFIKN